MTRFTRQAGALAALMMTASAPAFAQEAGDQPLFQLRPGYVTVQVTEGLAYQVPVTVATEICPDIDDAYMVTDFEGTTEVVCEVTTDVATEQDFENRFRGSDDTDETSPDPVVASEGEVGTDAGAEGVTDGSTDTGTDTGTDAGTDTGTDVGTDAGVDAGTDSGTDAGADAGVDADVDAGTDTDTDTEAGSGG